VNLNAIAGDAIQGINPDTVALIRKSAGYTKTEDYKQVPAYVDYKDVPVQIQALDGRDLRQVDGLNIQGTARAAYINGPQWSGVIRADAKGGDLIIIADGPDKGTWLIVKMLESWATHVKVCIVLQQKVADR